MDDKELLRCEQIGVRLALEAGRMMSAASGRNKEVKEKANFADLVTETDKEVEEFLFKEFKLNFPNFRFIGEETSSKVGLSADPTWIIDPVDGTMNFVHTFPFVCVSIGLAVNRVPVLGIVYSPFLERLYTARKGCGAYCNGRPISVRSCESLEKSLIICGLNIQRDEERRNAMFANMEALAWRVHGTRDVGSAALSFCYVAEGFADAFYDFGPHVWDMAAGYVILTEAGGTMIDTKGGPLDIMSRRFMSAGSEKIAQDLSKELRCHLELERD